MRKALVGGVLAGVVAVCSLAGCTNDGDESAEPVTTPLPTVAAEGADLVCGMDREDLHVAMGLAIGRVEDHLSVRDGAGSGQCTIWAETESLVNGPLVFVTFYEASSPDGVEARARVDGELYREPDVTYDSLDGAAWLDRDSGPDQLSLWASSMVFWGQTLIGLTTSRGGIQRDHAADLAALTQQVAASYGLQN